MSLLNVRLSPDDARRAAELRKAGIQISDIVRQAIRVYLAQEPERRAFEMGNDGAIDKIKGRIKEAAGAITDDDELREAGKLDQAVGKVKDAAGRVVDKVRDAIKEAKDRI